MLTFKFVNFKFHGPTSILKYQKRKVATKKQFHMKDTGKSSSRKLRHVIYYTLYRTDPQKTHYTISFSAKMSKIENSFFFLYISHFPPNSRSTAPFRRLFIGRCWALGVILTLASMGRWRVTWEFAPHFYRTCPVPVHGVPRRSGAMLKHEPCKTQLV